MSRIDTFVLGEGNERTRMLLTAAKDPKSIQPIQLFEGEKSWGGGGGNGGKTLGRECSAEKRQFQALLLQTGRCQSTHFRIDL